MLVGYLMPIRHKTSNTKNYLRHIGWVIDARSTFLVLKLLFSITKNPIQHIWRAIDAKSE